jgi:hypothetical protein
VSKGAQKNFAEFAKEIGATWEAKKDDFNEDFFREAIAKAIVFRETERIVTDQPWYTGGYRANIVAYAISKLAHDVQERGRTINFANVWKRQGLPQALKEALSVATTAVSDVITKPLVAGQNVTEWAKQQACWKRVQDLKITWPKALDAELISRGQVAQEKKSARRDKRMLDGIEAQTLVVNAGSQFWAKAFAWARKNHRLSPKDSGILLTLATPGKLPSEKQSLHAIELLTSMQRNGCDLALGVVQRQE